MGSVVSVDPGFGHFLRTAATHRLLSPVEEADLGKRAAAGREANRLLISEGLTEEERNRLKMIVRLGDTAAEKLFRHNVRLVVNLARRFSSVAAGPSYTVEDRVQEGLIGLMRAVEKYDSTLGFRFTTYSTWWVRQALQRAALSTVTVRLPAHVVEEMTKLRRARNKLIELGGVLSEKSLAQVSGLDRSAVRRALKAEPLLLIKDLDSAVGSGSGTLADLIASTEPGPSALTVDADLATRIRRQLSDLPHRQRFILERRFGFVEEREWTLEELGLELGLTRERVRQLQNQALETLAGNDSLAALR